jgi:hypothetical protein
MRGGCVLRSGEEFRPEPVGFRRFRVVLGFVRFA